MFYINCPHYPPKFKQCTNISIRLQIKKFLNVNFFHHPVLLLPFQILSPAPCLQTSALLCSTSRTRCQYTHKTTDKVIVSCISIFRLETEYYSILSFSLSPSSPTILVILFLLARKVLESHRKVPADEGETIGFCVHLCIFM